MMESVQHQTSNTDEIIGNQLMQNDEAKFFLASVLHSLQDSVITINLEGRITSWNKGAERLFGYTAAEAIGQWLHLINGSADLQAFTERVDLIRSGKRIDTYQEICIRQGGSLIKVEVTLSPINNDEGEIIGVSSVVRNVSDLRRSQIAVSL